MGKPHTERDREREGERCKWIRWECCVFSCLTTCDRPALSRSSFSDDCFYVEAVTPFNGSDFMKEGIKFHEIMTITIDLNDCLRCIPGLKETVSFFPKGVWVVLLWRCWRENLRWVTSNQQRPSSVLGLSRRNQTCRRIYQKLQRILLRLLWHGLYG